MFLRSTALYLPASLFGPLLQLATIIVLAHWLPPAALGLYALIVAVQDLTQIATQSWWSQYVLRYLDGRDEALRRRQDVTEIAVLAGSAAAQAALIAASVAWLGGQSGSPELMAAAACSGVLRATLTHAAIRARAAQAIGLHSLAQLGGPGLSLAFTLIAFTAMQPGLTTLFWAVALAHALLLPIMLHRLAYRGPVRGLRFDRAILRQALGYGLFTTLGAGLSWVTLQSMRFIIDVTLGAAAVGLVFVGWGIGQRIATQIGVLATTAIFPLAAQRAREETLAAGLGVMRSAAPLFLGLLVPAVIGVFAIAEPLALLVAPAPYQAMTAAILPLATLTGAIRVFRNHLLDEMLQLDAKPGLMARLDLAEAVLTILFCLIGALAGGIWGALLGCLAATSLATALALVVTVRLYGWPIAFRDLVTISVAGLVMAAALASAPGGGGPWSLPASIAIGGASYLAACALLDRQRLGAMLRRQRAAI